MKPQRLWFTTWTISLTQLCATVLFAVAATQAARAQSFTNFRIANGTSGENPAVLWVGVDQGFYRKHGLNVEVIYMRVGSLAVSALVSGDVNGVYQLQQRFESRRRRLGRRDDRGAVPTPRR